MRGADGKPYKELSGLAAGDTLHRASGPDEPEGHGAACEPALFDDDMTCAASRSDVVELGGQELGGAATGSCGSAMLEADEQTH